MKRKVFILAAVLVLVLSLALTSCSKPCEHEWEKANCEDPKTCELCGETKGAPLGHSWKAATCTDPKTCENCEKVSGEALGHTWVEATCEDPKYCSTCNTQAEDALGHTWVDATTEAPKTCATCQATEGDPIDTDDRFVTALCKDLFGSWTGEYTQTAEDFGLTGVDAKIVSNTTLIFQNDGTLIVVDDFGDLETYKTAYHKIQVAIYYVTLEQMYGYDQAASDAAMVADTGMTVPEYVQTIVDEFTEDDLRTETEFVYYVEDGSMYWSTDWDAEMTEYEFSLDGDTMNLDFLGTDLVLTKAAA